MKKTEWIIFLIVFALFLITWVATPSRADTTQNNTSGSNTSITGGYTNSTTYESGSSSASTTTNNTTSNIKSAPPTATAPGLAPSGIDVCSVSASAGVQTFGLGVSGGKSFRDKNCERIKLSRELNSLGMKVAAVAILCQDERVFFAMEQAGTPCPFEGKIGKQAKAAWKKYDKLRPDYETYVQNLKIIEKKNEEEQEKITEEMTKLDADKQKEDIQTKQKIDWKEPK